jgi:cellulose synthase/poly-beta-1,6-N-acetylglucosamine synthase-like glycosyltransferase
VTLVPLALFALCGAVCAYLYAGYPALVWALARLRPRAVRSAPVTPSVSLVVPAYNEEAVIGEKLRNCLELDYPREELEVLVVSDGSTDATEEIAASFGRRGVRLLRLPRGGKAAALDAAAGAARGEILVLTDANATLDRDALRHLVAPFADSEVGGVCGRKLYRQAPGADATAAGEGLYWRYDQWQKEQESRLGSVFAADGTLYALRRELYVPIADPAQADDIAISTRIVLQGRRLVLAPAAVAREDPPAEGRQELRRKVRVTNHSVRALLNLGPALWTSGFYSVELVSHKLLRHLAPFFLLGLLGSSVWLAPQHPLFLAAAGLQLIFYTLALAGFLLRRSRWGRSRLLSTPYYFTMVNTAALLGVLSVLRGRRLRQWAPRSGFEAPPPATASQCRSASRRG